MKERRKRLKCKLADIIQSKRKREGVRLLYAGSTIVSNPGRSSTSYVPSNLTSIFLERFGGLLEARHLRPMLFSPKDHAGESYTYDVRRSPSLHPPSRRRNR
jgi:hypothetical protein